MADENMRGQLLRLEQVRPDDVHLAAGDAVITLSEGLGPCRVQAVVVGGSVGEVDAGERVL